MGPTIEQLIPPVSESDLQGLAQLLVDAVESGAAVSFVAPLTRVRAQEWWRRTIAAASSASVLLVARDAGRIVGTVQLHPGWAPNQPHRAEISKLIVQIGSRRSGLGTRLVRAIEDEATRAGFSLLTLDTKGGSPAERLYRRLGWTYVGTIPRFAVDPDGTTLHDDVIFYKELK
jgi:GNAT superfamily N-acetyltransferase